jgi:4'-phosphopantetheinyl transferase
MIATALPFTIDVKIWNLDASPEEVARLRTLLSLDELQRAAGFAFPHLTNRYIVAHAMMRELLAPYVNQAPENLDFVASSFGKPAIAGAAPPYFNLSHSEGLAALAVTWRGEIGIDIERVHAHDPDLAAYAFSSAERAALEALPHALQSEAFFRCWTFKEAFLKAMGNGHSISLQSFDVALAPHEPARLLRFERAPDGELESWRLLPFEPAGGFAGAVAIRSADPSPSLMLERLL